MFRGAVVRRHRWRLGNNTTTVNRGQPCSVLNAASHTSDPTSRLDCLQPLPLLRPESARSGLHLDAGEHCDALTHHLRGDRACRPADQIGAALGQAELHRSAVLVAQGASVVAMQPHRAAGALEADLLLDLLFRWQGLAAASVVAA